MAIETGRIPAGLRSAMTALAGAAAELAVLIRRGGDLGAAVGTNADGDGQKALDVIADGMFCTALRGAGVRWLASEEQEQALELDPQGSLAVAIDPPDRYSHHDPKFFTGPTFSTYPALPTRPAQLLPPTTPDFWARL